jgi:hypothetical protein
VLALGCASFLFWRQRATATPSADKAPQTASTTVTLNVTAFPAGARLYLDDQPLASNPLFETVARDQRAHTIEARAIGYVSDARTLRFDQSANIVLMLSPLAAPAATVAAVPQPLVTVPPGKRALTRLPAPSPSPPSPDCAVPYTLDSAGVKHFKPECL